MELWFISDTHWGHDKMYKAPFLRTDGTSLRPFSSADEADWAMEENWNKVVKPSDHIYHLGDVTMDAKYLDKMLPRLNGHKRLVRGNHDIYKTRFYAKYFEEIYGVRVLDGLIFSHVPIHPDCINQRWQGNIHGHLHSNLMTDPRYLNICVEYTNYTPISLVEVKRRLIRQLEQTK